MDLDKYIIYGVIIVLSISIVNAIDSGCIDSDNGKTYSTKGNVTYSVDSNSYCAFNDICIGKILKEYYCTDGKARYTYYDCGTQGCTNGKCNSANPQPYQYNGSPNQYYWSGSTDLARVWALDDTETVKEDDISHPLASSAINPIWKNNKVSIFGGKNEIVAFQLILQGGNSPISNVNVLLNNLSNGNYIIKNNPASQGDPYNYIGKRIELFKEDYVNVLENSAGDSSWWYGARPLDINGQDYKGRIPEALVPFEVGASKGGAPFSVAAKKNAPIWVDVYISKDASPGLYTGQLIVLVNGVIEYSIPVELTVYNFVLPDETHFKNFFIGDGGDGEGILSKHRGTFESADYNLIEGRYFQMAHRHRMDLDFNALAPDDTSNEFRNINDLKKYLNGEYYTATYKYEGPGTGVGHGTYSIGTYDQPDGWFTGFTNTQAAWVSASNKWVNWFKQNAPKVEIFKYMEDEAPYDRWSDVKLRASWIPKDANGKRILMTYGTLIMHPELYSAMDFFTETVQSGYQDENTHGTTAGYDYINANQLRAQGKKIGIYNSNLPSYGAMEISPPADQRITPWIAWKYKVDQYFLWQTMIWNKKNWGQGTFTTSNTFEDLNGVTTGGGFLFYPGEQKDLSGTADDKGLKGPIASIRMKAWRRGQQDYEYLWLAKQSGKNVDTIVNSVVPRAFNDYGTVPGEPNYESQSQQPPWAKRGYKFENARKQLAVMLAQTN